MKNLLVIAFASLLAVSAYAHCGSCGVGDSKDHGEEAAPACKTCEPCGENCECAKCKGKAECEVKDTAAKKSACCPMSGKAS